MGAPQFPVWEVPTARPAVGQDTIRCAGVNQSGWGEDTAVRR
jgi:hypothetical protein